MAYQINKSFASNQSYSLSGDKKAIFNTTNNDIIKSPVPGTVDSVDTSSITIKDNDGNKFIISNITPSLTQSQTVSTTDTIGNAKGKIILEIKSNAWFSSNEKVEDYLNYTAAAAAAAAVIPTVTSSDKPKIKPENQLWRTPIKQYYAPLSTGVNLINKAATDIFGEEVITDESLLEDIKRIKKLLK